MQTWDYFREQLYPEKCNVTTPKLLFTPWSADLRVSPASLPKNNYVVGVAMPMQRERERRAIWEKQGRENETTWQGNCTFGGAASKRTSGNSERRNRNGNLVQSKGFLLIAASEQVWWPLKSKIARETGTLSTRLIPQRTGVERNLEILEILAHDAGQKSFEEEENETLFY